MYRVANGGRFSIQIKRQRGSAPGRFKVQGVKVAGASPGVARIVCTDVSECSRGRIVETVPPCQGLRLVAGWSAGHGA
jgi:hypothetical protein